MTDDQRLTLEELASAVGMTTRNVRAYQTRGLLHPPRRAGRNSVYGEGHVQRLKQVQQARARGASLQLLRTLIAEGRDLDVVWESRPEATPRAVVDVTDAPLGHTAQCLADLEVPLQDVLTHLGGAGVGDVPLAVETLAEAGVFTRHSGGVRAPGAYGCAAEALHDQGVLDSAGAALHLTQLVTEAAGAVASAVAGAVRALDGEARRGAATRLGELAGAIVAELVALRVARSEAPAPLGDHVIRLDR